MGFLVYVEVGMGLHYSTITTLLYKHISMPYIVRVTFECGLLNELQKQLKSEFKLLEPELIF